MKNIEVMSLVPNSYFTESVYLDTEYIILTSDIPVSMELIQRLKKWNFSHILSDGEPIVQQTPPDGSSFVTPGEEETLDTTIKVQEKHERIMTFYFDLIAYVDRGE